MRQTREMDRLRKDVEESKQAQARIADKICVLTIENKAT